MRGSFFFLYLLACSSFLGARPLQQESHQQAMSRLRNEISNHESELFTLQERLRSQEVILESLHREVAEKKIDSHEGSFKRLEASMEGFIGDLQKLKDHSNKLAEALTRIEKAQQGQEKTVARLEKALKTLIDGLDGGEDHVYTVKAGDSLEKIARSHKISIKKIKESNGLKTDQIRVGQVLKLSTASP